MANVLANSVFSGGGDLYRVGVTSLTMGSSSKTIISITDLEFEPEYFMMYLALPKYNSSLSMKTEPITGVSNLHGLLGITSEEITYAYGYNNMHVNMGDCEMEWSVSMQSDGKYTLKVSNSTFGGDANFTSSGTYICVYWAKK